MARYMVVERFREGHSATVYARFAEKGRMLPPGLSYIDSWLSAGDDTCYQLMETNQPETFETWIARWGDLVAFEIIKLKRFEKNLRHELLSKRPHHISVSRVSNHLRASGIIRNALKTKPNGE